MAPRLPTRLQSTLSTLLLLALSAVLAPVSFAISLFFSLTHTHAKAAAHPSRPPSSTTANGHAAAPAPVRTVLVNGARMQKSLAICRTFARNGWRVVLVEEQGWGNLAATRFSNSISKFHLLPSSSLPPRSSEKGGRAMTPYIEALVQIALREKVDLFFPCSGAGSTGQDAVAAAVLLERTGGRVRSMIQTPELVEALHEKDRFIALLQRLNMAAPRSEIVYSVDEALSKLQSDGYPRSILKCAAELDDIGRADMTLYPLLHPTTHEPDWDRTRHRLKTLPIPLCARTPYILQEFIGDRTDPSHPTTSTSSSRASEWCTHATVVDGQLTAFVCCPSNDMLMTYYPASHTVVGELALRWTSTFLYRLAKFGETPRKASVPMSPLTRETVWSRDTLVGRHAPRDAGITGQFSMDFIYQPATRDEEERLVAIECNPRVHTAICLLVGNPALGDALIPASLSRSGTGGESLGKVGEMDELSYLSSLSLPVMEAGEEEQHSTRTDLAALSQLPPTWASSRLRFYHAKSLLARAYTSNAALPQSWIGHDLPARLLPALLSPPWMQALMTVIHPLWAASGASGASTASTVSSAEAGDAAVIKIPSTTTATTTTSITAFDLAAAAPLPPLTDPSFAKDDPWPFFALYHLQWPQLLLWQLLVRRNKWSRINVSTARIFEC